MNDFGKQYDYIEFQYDWLAFAAGSIGIILTITIGWTIISAIFFKVTKKDPNKQQWRNKASVWINSSPIGALIELLALALCIVSCFVFAYLSKKVSDFSPKAAEDPTADWVGTSGEDFASIFTANWLIVLELVISIYLILDYLLFFVLASDKFSYVFSLSAIATVFTCTPGIVGIIIGRYFWGFQFLRFTRTYKTIQFFKENYPNQFDQGILGPLILLIATVMSILFTTAGLIFVFENTTMNPLGQVDNLFSSLYFIVTFSTTVGFGDISPKAVLGRLTFMITILVNLALLPAQINSFISILSERRDIGQKSYNGKSHVVLFAHEPNSIIPFMREFFHLDREEAQTARVCVMLPMKEVPKEVDLLLKEPFIKLRATRLQGSPLVENDLKRVNLEEADGVFLLSDKFAVDTESEDAKTILEAFAVRKAHPDLKMYVQIINTKNKDALKTLGPEAILCVSELRMGILAQASMCPGFSSLVGNLIRSYAPEDDPKAKTHELEYKNGAGNEIYVTKDFSNFHGQRFNAAARTVFARTGALLIGVCKVPINNSDDERRKTATQEDIREVFLNPGSDYIIEQGEQGVVIAQDGSVIETVQTLWVSKDKSEESVPLPKEANDKIKLSRLLKDLKGKSEEKKEETKEATVEERTIVSAKEVGISDHIILIGGFNEISYYIVRLRAYPLAKPQDIIILASSQPDESSWNRINELEDVYLVQGNPTDPDDLERAGALTASKIVILSGGDGDKSDLAIDARQIMSFRTLKTLDSFPIVDLVHSTNSRFLGSIAPLGGSGDDTENAYYASGQVFTASMLDTLIVQAYFNVYVASVVDRLTEGLVFSFPIKEAFPDLKDVKNYGDLFKRLLEGEYLPIGLYRKSPNRLRYTVTSPAPTTAISPDDVVLVLDRGTKTRFLKVKAVSALKLWKAKGSNDTVKRKSANRESATENNDVMDKLKAQIKLQEKEEESNSSSVEMEEKKSKEESKLSKSQSGEIKRSKKEKKSKKEKSDKESLVKDE